MAKKEWLAKGADGLSFGERLGDLISKKGITQAELAKVTGIGQSRLSDYIAGKQIDKESDERLYAAPDCATVITLAKYFSVSADYLLGISKNPSPSMEIRAICDYTGLSESSAEYLHARRASKTGFLTRLIDGVLSDSIIDDKVPFWVMQSAMAGELASFASDFSEDKCDIQNTIAYFQAKNAEMADVEYVISTRDARDFYLQRAINATTAKVAGVVTDMRNEMAADIHQKQCDQAGFFRSFKLSSEESEMVKNGND